MPRAILAVASCSPILSSACIAIEGDNVKKGGGGDCDKMLNELVKKYGEPRIIEEGGWELGLTIYEW